MLAAELDGESWMLAPHHIIFTAEVAHSRVQYARVQDAQALIHDAHVLNAHTTWLPACVRLKPYLTPQLMCLSPWYSQLMRPGKQSHYTPS